MIRFGSMSITLLVGALYGALFAVVLATSTHNRVANRFLALLMLAFVLRMVPYIIGFAGYYDVYPWLSFMPYNVSLAFGPLLYFYARGLSEPSLPLRWWLHFVPVAVQFLYYCVVFAQPLEFKNQWDAVPHARLVYPIELTLTFVSMTVYWWASFRHQRGYETWMAGHVSQLEDHRVTWVRNFLVAMALTLALWMLLVAYDRLVAKLNYFHQFPFYVWLGVLVYYLGTEGYRHAGHRYPVWAREEISSPDATLTAPPQVPPREINWHARGEKWRQQLVEAEWWRDADLSLSSLARKLGTNTSDLSRGINEGLGVNFNELINRLRVDAVKAALTTDRTRNLLDIAFEAGFSSKASFNRSFKLYAGCTPTAWREQRTPASIE